MSFKAKLSVLLTKADTTFLDNQEVITWYPTMGGLLTFEYGEDVDFLEKLRDVKDVEVEVSDEGTCEIEAPDPDADEPDDLDASEPTKTYILEFYVRRPLRQEDL
jgi:hypothetical protein